MGIKAILFDSGRVLNRPATGQWFIPPHFFDCVDRRKWETLKRRRVRDAFKNAEAYIAAQPLIRTKSEELDHFQIFYQHFSDALPELRLTRDQISFLASDLVLNTEKYTFYDDALKILPAMKAKYKLAVVSDAWPSLADVFRGRDLYDCFGSFVISSVLGKSKPDREMYLTALEELNVLPEEAVFVDDNLANCQGAMKLGIYAVLLCRNRWQYRLQKVLAIGRNYKVINSLNQLPALLTD